MSLLVAEGVWKSYPRWRPGTRSLRSTLSPALRAERRSGTTRWALQDVSFTLEPGDALGVIGHNGAGKSTLLRLASGISRPTRGRLMVTPSAASVLSLGDTFNADLSGASNAITAAVIGGLSPREARAALPRAIEFAELSEFQDAPVRSYSDGMKLRLAFGVMTLLTPDLLIVDEILAVGDLSFQEKCMAHLENLRERGTAIVLASHDMEQIREQCDEALLLSRGQVLAYGEVEEVVAAHREEMANRTLAVTPEASPQSGDDRLVLNTTRFGSQEIRIAKVEVGSRSGAGTVTAGGDLDIQITLEAGARAEPVAIAVAIERDGDDVKCVGLSTELDEVRVDTRPGSNVTVSLQLPLLELRPGQYWVDVGVFPDSWAHAYDYHYRAYALRVTGESDDPAEPVYRPVNRRWAVEDNA